MWPKMLRARLNGNDEMIVIYKVYICPCVNFYALFTFEDIGNFYDIFTASESGFLFFSSYIPLIKSPYNGWRLIPEIAFFHLNSKTHSSNELCI